MIGTSTYRHTANEARQILAELHANVTEEQLGLLSTIWQHYLARYPNYAKTGGAPPWMTVRELMRVTNFDKVNLITTLQPLGGSVITLKGYGSQQTCELQHASLFLLPYPEAHKRYLVECVHLAKRRSLDEPPPPHVLGVELATFLGIAQSEMDECVAALSLAGFLNIGRAPDGDWAIQIPHDIDDLPRNADFESYALENIFAYFVRGLPVEENLQQDYRNRRTRLDQSSEGIWFVADPQLKRWLATDWIELQASIVGNAHRTTAILCRSILEGLLLDVLNVDAVASRSAFAVMRKREMEKVPTPDKWMLQDLIDVAGNLGVLPTFEVKLCGVIQEYGNRVHLGRQLRESVEVTADGAAVAVNAVRECIHALDVRARKRLAAQASATT